MRRERGRGGESRREKADLMGGIVRGKRRGVKREMLVKMRKGGLTQ